MQSPLSRTVQTVEMPGARWRVVFSLENLSESDAAALQAFLAALRGQAGRFYLYNMARQIPRGVATGTPLANGTNADRSVCVTDGWTHGALVLKAGDFIGIPTSAGHELKMVTADVTADGSGNATINIEPPARRDTTDNAAIVITRPTAIFMTDADSAEWTTAPGLLSSFSMAFTEDITA